MVEVRVRMGLHTGEPIVQRTGYVGMDVHRAARVAAAGYGGQILVSQSTRELVAPDLPPEIQLRSLGQHRLKDVRQPVEIYQVEADGLLTDFPALRTLETGDEPPTPGSPPFKGLEYFDEADAALFFGRGLLSVKLVSRISAERFLAVVGASGSGKSSLVRAGVLPNLRAQTTPAWAVRTLTPGARPIEALALAMTEGLPVHETAAAADSLASDDRALHLLARRLLGAMAAGARLLIVIDQLEELFTLCREESERSRFIANILHATATDGPVSILVTIRADFYDALAQYDLRTVVAEHQEYIGPMSVDELREAIEEPARAGGWEFAPGLVELILHDVGEEPGALPLLSHALLETWRRRRGTTMTLKAYAESGGVRGAIARTADRVYGGELDAEQQRVARAIFLRLTELGEGTQDTRRRAALDELAGQSESENEVTREVVAKLVDARLVTVGEASIEVAHEALIREWPTLREWLSENREGLRLHHHLTRAAEEWQLLDRDPSALYRGARLAGAQDWASANGPVLSSRENEFLSASIAQQEMEAAEREAQQRREIEAAEELAASQAASARRLRRRALLLTGALAIAALMAGAAIFLGISAQQSAAEAQTNFATAESQRLAGESSTLLQLQGSAELASLLALRGLDAHYSPQADMALQRAGRRDFGVLRMSHPRQVDTFSIAPDGQSLLSYSRDGTARLWSLADGSLLRELAVGPSFASVDYHPDGRHAAISSEKGTSLIDLENGEAVWAIEPGFEAKFTADGSELFIARGDRVDVVSGADGSSLRSLTVAAEGVTVSPDGDQLLVGDMLYDAHTGELVHTLVGHTNAINGTAFSPDGRLVATSSWDETAKVWDRATGELLQTMSGHSELLFGIRFSPDSRQLMTGSLDNTARLWDVATGNELRRLTGHTAGVYGADFTADGRFAATASADGAVRLWDLAQPVEAQTLAGHDLFVYAVAFSHDGRRIFTGSADGTGMIWDAETLAGEPVPFEEARVDEAAFSADGRYLLLAPETGPAQLWDAATNEPIAVLEGSAGGLTADFSADSRLLLAQAASEDDPRGSPSPAVGLWDVETRRLLRTFSGSGVDVKGALSPDGRLVVVAVEESQPNLFVYDAATGGLIKTLDNGSSGVSSLNFSPDSRHLLTGSRDNIARIFDVETGEARELVGHTNIIWGTAFSPDGRMALTGSQDRTARLWDVATGTELRRFASHDYSSIAGVAFSPDGETIAIGNFDGYAQLTPVELSDLHDEVCSRLLRDFMPVEREIFEIADDRATCRIGGSRGAD